MISFYQGDAAHLFTLTNPEGVAIERVAVAIGPLCKAFDAPIFPLSIDFTEIETEELPVGILCIAVSVWLEDGKTTKSADTQVLVRAKRVSCGG